MSTFLIRLVLFTQLWADCLFSLMRSLSHFAGKILRVETVKMKVTESTSAVINLDPDVLYWTDGAYSTMYLNYVRLFYIEGEPAHEEIGKCMRVISVSYQR